MDTVDCVVVGSGAVGLAIARALAQAGRDVIILEAAEAIGTGISSRNSEVIHAGIYYPKDSLMARFCVAGRHALYRFCADHGVPYRRCGKLIVATNEAEAGKLASIEARARANGVDDLRFLSAAEAQALEPALASRGALLSPSTGIVDSHHFMLALLGDAEAAGASLALNAPFVAGRAGREGIELDVGGDEPMTLACHTLVNAAGLEAPLIARNITGMPQEAVPTRYFAKGNYFTLSMRSPFSHLIYPVPEPGGLGVHLTIDLGGQAKFGPDVEWVETIDYNVDPARSERFYKAIRRYWPGLPDGSLQPGYAGVRPKIVPPSIAAQDFVVQSPSDHGVPGLINLFGIESPGLTSSLALANYVAEIAQAIRH
jgi:L-2-hydroxyglutarate oxidase LhgO